MFVRADIMPTFRAILLALLPILAMTAETAPAGSQAAGCGVRVIDPGLHAAFEQFDRQQSRTATRICGFHLNGAAR
jgi:hypothetical protein